MYKTSAKMAAILNFIVPGLGYIYAEKREAFGWIVLVSMIIFAVYSFSQPVDPMLLGSSLLLSLGFAYDVYHDVKEKL